jgi:uncharacterized protein (UPF0332 family)
MSQFDFKEFLNVAWFLQNTDIACSREAKYRSAVSRAYYAAFKKTHIYLTQTYGLDFSKKCEVHQEVIDEIARFDDDVSKQLNALRGWRNQCDYDENVSGLAVMLINATDQAQQVIDFVAPY